ncbi:hypothetical protein ACU4GD_19330 [Cupriavidus basilensis]
MRVEQKTRFAGLMYCEWEQGNIGFKDCDFSSQAYQPFAAGVMSALFSPGDSSGAQVVFDNCQIMGRHHYTTGQAPAGQGRSSYRNCDFLNYTYPDEAFVFSEGRRAGRAPPRSGARKLPGQRHGQCLRRRRSGLGRGGDCDGQAEDRLVQIRLRQSTERRRRPAIHRVAAARSSCASSWMFRPARSGPAARQATPCKRARPPPLRWLP